TIVTGQRPDRHGITANRIEDPARPGQVFTMASDDPFWWSATTPLWVDAERAGIRSATMFWPGSNVDFGGTRPADWQQYNQAVSGEQRVNAVIDWLRRPAAIRPRFVTLYFDTVDTAGHEFGPDDPRTTAAVRQVDAQIGALVNGLARLGRKADLVIVADHGMAAISEQRVIRIDQIIDPTLYRVIESGPFLTLEPSPGNADRLAAALTAGQQHIGQHMECWRKGDIPQRFHYGANPRVPAILCLADPGWMILPGEPKQPVTGGTHGYDNAAPDMAALFIAAGPDIRSAGTLPTFDNVDVEPLLRDLLGMPHDAAADGTDAPFREVIRK
ncbi:MAG: hypothetical protein RLZZ84_1010, partial [Pseudomonadota bacterium]